MSNDERIAELENTILELSKELNRLVKWQECPRCHGENYCRVDVETSTGGNPGRMYVCYDCRYPHTKGEPVFSNVSELLAYAGKMYPDAKSFDIKIDDLGRQETESCLIEGVAMKCHPIFDNHGQLTEDLNKALKATTREEFTKLYPM